MPRDIWICDQCLVSAPAGLAEETWPRIEQPAQAPLRLQGDSGRIIITDPTLVFHNQACLAVWVRTNLIEPRSQR